MSMDWLMSVKKQDDGHFSVGYNPTTKYTLKEAEDMFYAHMREYFPDTDFGCSIRVHTNVFDKGNEWFDLSAWSFTPEPEYYEVFIAMSAFVFKHFGVDSLHMWCHYG